MATLRTPAPALDPRELALCRDGLARRQAALRTALDEHGTMEHGAAHAGSSAEVHDLKDEAFASQLAGLRGMAREQMWSELAAVRLALSRIDAGGYGHCEDCGGDIGRERLLAQPSAARCLRCQERAEQAAPTR
jgi:DnaK suppressor protein